MLARLARRLVAQARAMFPHAARIEPRGRDVIMRLDGYSVAGVPGLVPGVEVQAILKRRAGTLSMLVWGHPSPIPLTARCTMPPVPFHPVYGPAARAEARALMAEAKRRRVSLGWYTESRLRQIAKGQRPLDHRLWSRTRAYVATVAEQRHLEHERRSRPLRVNLRGLGFGDGPTLAQRPELWSNGAAPTSPTPPRTSTNGAAGRATFLHNRTTDT